MLDAAKVRALQAYLAASSQTAATLELDGVLGQQTKKAITRAVQKGDPIVEPLAQSLGIPLNFPKDLIVLRTELAPVIKEFSATYKVPESYLWFCFDTETRHDESAYYPVFDQTYKGLGQFGADTWAGLNRVYKEFKTPYATGVRDTRATVEATCLLYLDSKYAYRKLAKRKGYSSEFTNAIAYLYHNQGSGQSAEILGDNSGIVGSQSRVAVGIVAQAKRDATQSIV